jgi:hypothetical protein
MPDPQLIENVWIRDRQVRNDQVGSQDFKEHVRSNIARDSGAISSDCAASRFFKGWSNETVPDALEVDLSCGVLSAESGW